LCRARTEADDINVKRTLFLLTGSAAIVGSYMAVVFGLAPAESLGSGTVASIALPALVSGLFVTGFIAMLVKGSRDAAGQVHELHAQLARKEVELTRLATHDDLTGLYSRHHFDTTVGLEFERAKRHDRAFAVLLVQLDGLDDFAEHAGSLSRGYVLSEVASLLRTTLRINDTGCRYADDALAVLLPETDLDGANIVAQRVRAQLAKREFFGRGKKAASSLTVSQGFAAFPCDGIASHQDLQKAAEAALQEAKAEGGGNIRAYDPPPSSHQSFGGPSGTQALAS
jgi:diguanylate cyclase (GGDEF)-like protein